jgi:hypothetical protein
LHAAKGQRPNRCQASSRYARAAQERAAIEGTGRRWRRETGFARMRALSFDEHGSASEFEMGNDYQYRLVR